MSHIYLATLGQRPEVITIALDWLKLRYPITGVALIHTDPVASPIATAFNQIRPVLDSYQPKTSIHYREVRRSNGQPLTDIEDTLTAESYYRAVITILSEFKQTGNTLHLMIAGGRKAMSVYAMLAASTLFGVQDKVWTLLSEPELIQRRGVYHLGQGEQDKIQMVALPMLPTRLAPGADALEMSERRRNPRADFLAKLSQREGEVAEALAQLPYATNRELSKHLGKAQSTVESQLESIYRKMVGFYDGGENVMHKRKALIDLLRGE